MTSVLQARSVCKTYQRDTMDDGELLAIISEMVLGYREGKSAELIQAIAVLKKTQYRYNEVKGVHELFEKCLELGDLAAELRQG